MDRKAPPSRRASMLLGALGLAGWLVLSATAAEAGVLVAPTSCVSTPALQCSFPCPTAGWITLLVTAAPTRSGDLVASGAAVCGGGGAN